MHYILTVTNIIEISSSVRDILNHLMITANKVSMLIILLKSAIVERGEHSYFYHYSVRWDKIMVLNITPNPEGSQGENFL